MKTLYDVLEVTSSASAEVIEAAWKTLSRKYHTDNRKTGDGEQIRAINNAHDVLKNPEARAAYDAGLAQQQQQANPFGGANPFGAGAGVNPFAYPGAYQQGGAFDMSQVIQQAAMQVGGAFLGNMIGQLDPRLRKIVLDSLKGGH